MTELTQEEKVKACIEAIKQAYLVTQKREVSERTLRAAVKMYLGMVLRTTGSPRNVTTPRLLDKLHKKTDELYACVTAPDFTPSKLPKELVKEFDSLYNDSIMPSSDLKGTGGGKRIIRDPRGL